MGKLISTAAMMVCMFSVVAEAQQRLYEREEEFLRAKPLINDPLPEVSIYAPDGTPFNTRDLRGHYTVLTFGCLTCPPSMWNIPGMEAVREDYAPKGVKFYFVFKSLAHPELAGDFVQPFTLEERLGLARTAVKRFGTKTPWIVDDIDNRFKHAMGDRPNSQFLISPEGIIVRKRAWANPIQVRRDLEELVGPVDHVTAESEIHLNLEFPAAADAAQQATGRISRSQMAALVIEPKIQPKGLPFYAKLRAEGDAELISQGHGKLYLGFNLDPLYEASWNNLAGPLSFQLVETAGVRCDKLEGAAEAVSASSDAAPREFLVQFEEWPDDHPLRLKVKYFACVGKETCHIVAQEYLIHRQRDPDGGGARGKGAGYWNPDDFAKQLIKGDKNQDGKLARSETAGIALPHFDKLDTNRDGFLQIEELKAMGHWLNQQHRPGTPASVETRGSDDSQ